MKDEGGGVGLPYFILFLSSLSLLLAHALVWLAVGAGLRMAVMELPLWSWRVWVWASWLIWGGV